MIRILLIPLFIHFTSLAIGQKADSFVMVLGITQDGGYPHIGCDRQCCQMAKIDSVKKFVTSLALVDADQKKWWLFEATPDFSRQLDLFQKLTNKEFHYLPDGIFITHAHIGHYTGLMYLGREALGAKKEPVYVLPKMQNFLSNNGPWSQLVTLENIELQVLQVNTAKKLSSGLSVEPFLVPHRDEYSETVGYKILTPGKKYLFIPDIDKWGKWKKNLPDEVKQVDFAFLDGSFYAGDELPGRDINEVPHPFVTETIKLFMDSALRSKIVFIHFNHTNPLLWNVDLRKRFLETGFKLSEQGSTY